MSYTKKEWENDEVITDEALNNIENGIAANDTKNTSQDTEIQGLKEKDTSIEGRITALENLGIKGTSSQITKIATPSSATAEEIATKVNDIIDKLIARGVAKA